MKQVAIVDDSEDSRDLFHYVLGNDHEYITFASGEDFLKEFRPGAFELVLLDLSMPNIDGFEVFTQIQKIDKDVPVVAITARAQPQEREKALAMGFCDYFVKPILEIEEFRKTVHSHIGKCANPSQKS